jgi:hypothetical protein
MSLPRKCGILSVAKRDEFKPNDSKSGRFEVLPVFVAQKTQAPIMTGRDSPLIVRFKRFL